MARERSPNRDKAFEVWKNSEGKMPLKDIAEQLNVSDTQIRKWKNQDKWDDLFNSNVTIGNSNVTNQINGNVTKRRGPPLGSQNAKGHGAPKGNGNAVGNKGGRPAPGNKNAEKHGFFSRIFPDDPETREIIESINIKSPIEILWENIVIQYTAIARAQRIMFVQDQDDIAKELKSSTSGEKSDSESYIIQFAWDRQASLMQVQSKAMKTLEGLISKYEAMIGEEQQLKLEKMKAEIAKVKGDNDKTKGGQVVVVHSIPRPPKE